MKNILSLIIRIMALALLVLFFVPHTIVSCDSYGTSYEVPISPMKLATGTITVLSNDPTEDNHNEYTEDIEAQPIYFLMLAIPIVIIILGKKLPVISFLLNIFYLGMSVVITEDVLDYVNTSDMGRYLDVTPMGSIIINTITPWLFIVLIVAIIISIREKKKAKNAAAVCPGCGQIIDRGKSFCGKCGAKLPEPKDSAVRNEEKMFCAQCGHQLKNGQKFCGNCGAEQISDIQIPVEQNIDSTYDKPSQE